MNKPTNIIIGITRKFRYSISAKLISIFILITGILFITNISMNAYINQSLRRVDTVYSSNIVSNELYEKLKEVQSYVHEYLNTKSAATLENYYKSEQEFRSLINSLNDEITDDEMLMLEKNIKSMSETYLNLADETVKEKRGRNVEKYKTSYENTKQLYQYINSYISNLSTEQLKQNSANYELLMLSLRYTEALSLMIMIAIVVISLCLLLIILRNMIRPLIQLAHSADEISRGNFDSEVIIPKTKDEIGILASTFHTMLKNIKSYIGQIKENMETEQKLKEQQLMMENHLKDAQLKYLQAQINPHFLFNSLNAGAQLAMMEEAEQTCLFVTKMADFFRYNVKKMEQDAILSEEIESVDNYIYILNVRFTGDIHFEKIITDGVDEVRVPSMILQPIVENAVRHGISDIERPGEILLKVENKEGYLDMLVRDNGIGMTQDRIEEIMSGQIDTSEVDLYSTGIGLNNVINRLRLYYRQDNLLTIHSDGADRGTEIRITIPKSAKN